MKRVLFAAVFLVLIASLAGPFSGQIERVQAGGQIILSQSGKVTVTLLNTITNDCNGEAGIMDGATKVPVFRDYNHHVGGSVTLGPFNAGQELIFYITPWRYCGVNQGDPWDDNNPSGIFTYLSTLEHARVSNLGTPNSWRIDFEDLPDYWPGGPGGWDFDDVTLLVRLEGEVPDFHQDDPTWTNDTYDHTSYTIGQVGCALTAAADVINFYGTPANPQTLDTCLSRDDVRGYLRAVDDPACPDGADCNQGALRWTKLAACSNPSNPSSQDNALIRFAGKFNLGYRAPDPVTGQRVPVTPALLRRYIDLDLENGRPVILELVSPVNNEGVHYVVAKSKSGSTYEILDPTNEHTLLSEYGEDSLIGIVRYAFSEKRDGSTDPNFPGFNETVTINAFGTGLNVAIFDAQGRRTGYSPFAAMTFNDVPESGYYFQRPVTNDATGQVMGSGMPEAYINFPVRGRYIILVYGPVGQPFGLSVQFQDEPLVTYSGLANGSIPASGWVRYAFTLNPGSTPTLSLLPPSEMHFPLIWSPGL